MRMLMLVGVVGLCPFIAGCDEEAVAGATLDCEATEDWDPEWEALEEEVLVLINQQRARETDCGTEGVFPPAPPVTANAALRCAARVHSADMSERNYFDHTNPDGLSPWDRMAAAGYPYVAAGENIAAGYETPAQAVAAWIESDGHCANVMSKYFVDTGVGFYEGEGTYGLYWTQTFASR